MGPSPKPFDLTAESICRRAWNLTTAHFPLFLILVIVMQVLSSLPNAWLTGMEGNDLLLQSTLADDEFLLSEPDVDDVLSCGVMALFSALLVLLGEFYLSGVYNHMLVGTVRGGRPDLTASFRAGLRLYLQFLGASLVMGVTVVFAGLFCLVPGIYLAIRWIFVPLIAVEHPELSLGDTFARSWRLTQGHTGDLLLLGILAVLINIAGLLCCCVGLLFTQILTSFMLGEAYVRLTADETPESVAEGENDSAQL